MFNPVGDGLWIHEIDFVSQAVPTITELAANGAMLSRSNSHVLGPKILIAGGRLGSGLGFLASWLYEPLGKAPRKPRESPEPYGARGPVHGVSPKTPGPKPRGAAARGVGRWSFGLRGF